MVLPQVLGTIQPSVFGADDTLTPADRASAAHLLSLTARVQREVGAWLAPGPGGEAAVPTLSLDAEVRLRSPEERAAFSEELTKALTHVIGRYASPARTTEGGAASGTAYRVVVGCYPIPSPMPDGSTTDPTVGQPGRDD